MNFDSVIESAVRAASSSIEAEADAAGAAGKMFAEASRVSTVSEPISNFGKAIADVGAADLLPATDPNITSLIDKRGGTQAFYNQVAHALKDVPTPLLEIAKKANVRVATASNYLDIAPELKDKHPAGYKPGSTYRDVPAAVQQKSEGSVIGLSEEKLRSDKRAIKSAIAHEIGHVVDKQLKPELSFSIAGIEIRLDLPLNASDSPDFQAAYYRDLSKLTAKQKAEVSYYVQPDKGRGETFAELVQYAVNDSAYSNLPKYFPETLRVVRAKINMPDWRDKLGSVTPGGAASSLGQH